VFFSVAAKAALQICFHSNPSTKVLGYIQIVGYADVAQFG
jgi:hypothetical protein